MGAFEVLALINFFLIGIGAFFLKELLFLSVMQRITNEQVLDSLLKLTEEYEND